MSRLLRLTLLIVLSATGCGPASSTPPDVPVNTESAVSDQSTPDLHMHKRGADLNEATCAIVLLHGYGAPGTDLVSLADVFALPPTTAWIFPEAPIRLPQGGRAWYQRGQQGFEDSLAMLSELLQDLAANYPECPVVIGGFSQGATLSANLLDTENCPTLAAGLLFSPANLLEFPPKTGEHTPTALIAHGRDDQVLAFEEAEALREKLKECGCDIRWVPFDGGHTLSPDALRASRDLLMDVSVPSADPPSPETLPNPTE